MISFNNLFVPAIIAFFICISTHIVWYWGLLIWFVVFAILFELTKIPRIRNIIFLFYGIINGSFVAAFTIPIINDIIYKDSNTTAYNNMALNIFMFIIFIIIFIAINKAGADEDEFFDTKDYYATKDRKRYKKLQKRLKKEERKAKSASASEKTKYTHTSAKDEGVHTQTNWDKL